MSAIGKLPVISVDKVKRSDSPLEAPLHKTINKFVHIDLKGAPPKPSYLKSLYPLFVKWGVKGILLEWEDCFPYSAELQDISNQRYSYDDAMQIVNDIKEADLEVIPLIQTFGHLEFVLKHKKFQTYREVPLYSSSLCPSYPNSFTLISALISQVITFHGNIKSFHIGADEVWHMGICARCKARIAAGESKEDLFLKHVKSILQYIKKEWPHIRIIMWDDMLREIDEPVILSYDLKSLVELMIWHYNSAETFCLPPDLWRKYSNFQKVWIAGSFKGSSGGSQLVPFIPHHASNVLQWIRSMESLKSQCQGFVLTGWSRYDHFAALCETLPCGILSLGVCLKVLSDGSFTTDTVAAIESEMKSQDLSTLLKSPESEDQCLYSTWQVFKHTTRVAALRQSAQALLIGDQLQTWMNDYQVAHDQVNPMQIIPIIPVLNNIIDEFTTLEKDCRAHMTKILYDDSINEWIQTYIVAIRSRVISVLQVAEAVVAKCSKALEDSMDF